VQGALGERYESNFPPKIHNLVRLIGQTHLRFSEEEMDFFRKLNDFQLEGRYPDYKQKLFSDYKFQNTDSILKKVNRLRLCLVKELQ
jgi:HEPN domain-containing protein